MTLNLDVSRPDLIAELTTPQPLPSPQPIEALLRNNGPRPAHA